MFASLSGKAKAILIAIVAALLIGCGNLAFGGGQNSADDPSSDVKLADTGGSAVTNGKLSFIVQTTASNAASEYEVAVTGTTRENASVSEKYTAKVGQSYSLDDFEPGKYKFSVDLDPDYDGVAVLSCQSISVSFDKTKDVEAKLNIVVDEAATDKAKKEAAATKSQDDTSAKSQDSTSTKSQSNTSAKSQDEASAKSQDTSGNSAASDSSGSGNSGASGSNASAQGGQKQATQSESSNQGSYVYIATSGDGKKYHSDSSCSQMIGTEKLTVAEAKRRGFTPCGKCHPPA